MTELRLRDEGLKWREIEGEMVAVDIRTSTYISANPSGMALWEALSEGTSREALAERLVDAFGIDRERAAADVDAFLADLRGRDLLEA
jgi:2-keto-3-deoxy-L-rhamnonate aldolase RhmA